MRSTRTLLIDDDRFSLAFLGHQLRLQGFDHSLPCQRATDAIALLEAEARGDVAGEPIALVICNLQMPEIDGVEIVRHLARIGYRGSLILIGGGHPRVLQAAEQLAKARQLRILGSLSKPLSATALQSLIEHHSTALPLPACSSEASYSVERLREAIDENELRLHYQPKVRLQDNCVIGVEALARWYHPQDGVIAPMRFIPLAEQGGLIDSLTRSILAQALLQARHWQDLGLQLSVAVNVSMDDLVSLEFPDVVLELAQRAGVPPRSLVLEVTESRLMEAPLATLDILTRLRLKNVGLAIDDFGSGYSSLKQLRDLPFDELKIDSRFVSGAHGDPALRAIVEATLRMARQFGMCCVAEGVEDRADWDYLNGIGCDVVQGFGIGRAMPGPLLVDWLREFNERQSAVA